jgi:hypothetical protein
MSSNINIVLADCERQAKALVEEIEKYRAASVLSEHVAKSLDKLCVALQDTHARILPLTTANVRRAILTFGAMAAINSVLLVVICVLLWLKP